MNSSYPPAYTGRNSFTGILSFCFLFPHLPHALTHLLTSFLPSFLQIASHHTPHKHPGALKVLTQSMQLPLGYLLSNCPPHPLLVTLTPSHPSHPHTFSSTPSLPHSLLILLLFSNYSFLFCTPLQTDLPIAGCSITGWIHETLLKALPLSSPNQPPTKSQPQTYILHKHTTSIPPPSPGRQAA